jgi:hypothetical protein
MVLNGRLALRKSTHRVSTPYRRVGESVTNDNTPGICNQKSTSNQDGKFAAIGQPTRCYPAMGLEEINGDLPEADFWPGITSGWLGDRLESERLRTGLPLEA